jgi:hypothetical protein
MRKGNSIVLLLIGIVLFFSCEYKDIEYDKPVVIEEMSFSNDIEPIFKLQSCTNCHSGAPQPDLTTGNAYYSLMANHCIDTVKPAESKIYVVPKTGSNHSATFTSLQSQQILTWIEQGAKNN